MNLLRLPSGNKAPHPSIGNSTFLKSSNVSYNYMLEMRAVVLLILLLCQAQAFPLDAEKRWTREFLYN